MMLPVLKNCEGCGACCQHMIVPPFIINATQNEPQQRGVPTELLEELLPLWEVRFHLKERPCVWYVPETKQCRYYELRPQACRDFELNSPSCHACREKHGIG